MNTLTQRIALYLTLGLVLNTLSVSVSDWQFWSILALFLTSEFMVRKGTEETAMALGVAKYLSMDTAEQSRIRKIYNDTIKSQQDE